MMRLEVCLVLMVLALGTSSILAVPPMEPLKLNDFKEVLAAAVKLESAEMLSSRKQQVAEQRDQLLYSLAREVKSKHCDDYFDTIQRAANDFKIKAEQFLEEESKQNKGWFGFMRFNNPMRAMKDMAKIDSYLGIISERYESQAKTGLLKKLDIDCDLIKFHIRSLHNLMFVLQTDIKYLLMEQQQIINKAIYEQLKGDKFVSNVNFYEVHELTDKQREILLGFFSDRVDDTVSTVGEAVDHFYDPGQYIIGRLLDSCEAVQRFKAPWEKHEDLYNDVCPQSKSDLKGHLFAKDYKFNKFESVFEFCREFLDAL